MASKYLALLTNRGATKLAQAAALGTKINITQMAVGDGGGTLPTPSTTQTALIGEKRRASLNTLSVDTTNTNQIIAEQVIPEDEGGWWIREIGLFDSDGELIAIANCAETYKPLLAEGSGRTQTIRMLLIVSSTDAVTIKIDPSVVLATRQYADNLITVHLAAVDPHPQYAHKASPVLTGTPKAPTASASDNSTQIASTAFVRTVAAALIEAALKAPIASPNLTGTPTAPTPVAGNSSTQVATTAFVANALAALAGSAPETLDTLKEIADALGNDPNFATTMLTTLAGKMDVSKNGSDIPDVAAFLINLGIGAGSLVPVGVPVPYFSATPPAGWIKCNGSSFSSAAYPKLALAYPSLVLPDLRSNVIRGWDDGRGIDTGRVLLSEQTDAIRNIYGNFLGYDYGGDSSGAWTGAFTYGSSSGNQSASTGTAAREVSTAFSAANVVPTASENRVRNIAFNYIVRAA